MVFPVVMYKCEKWTIKKAERQRIDAFELCHWRFLGVPWTTRRSNQSILKESNPNIHCKDWWWSSNILATWSKEPTHWKRPWCWEGLKAGREGDDRGQDGWMASPTQRTWFDQTLGDGEGQGSRAWCSPWSCRVGHDWVTEPPPTQTDSLNLHEYFFYVRN